MKQKVEPVTSSFELPPKVRLKDRLRRLNKTIVLPLLVLFVVLLVILIHYVYVENSASHKVVFRVDGTKYTEGYIDKLIAYPLGEGASTRSALSMQAFNYYKEISVAQKLGLGLSNQSINQLIPDITSANASKTQKDSSWTALLDYNFGIQQELRNPNPTRYSGYVFVFYFGQHIQTGVISSTLPNTGNAKSIATDQSYAMSEADYYYKELKSNKMTPSQILSDVNSNSKLCADYKLNTCQSVYITDSNPGSIQDSYTTQLAGSPTVATYVGKQTKPGISPIETGQVPIVTSAAELTSSYTYVDTYYYFVDLQTVHLVPSNIKQVFSMDLATLPASYYGWPK